MIRPICHATILTLLAFVLVLAPLAVSAQDTTDMASCDATLVTLLVVAIQQYGYQPPLRLDFYDFDQYTALVSAAAGVELTDYPEETQVVEAGQQASDAVNQAATSAADSGLPALAEGLNEISDEVGDIASAGQDALEAGEAALNAGAAAIEEHENPTYLYYGGLPGEAEACAALRTDLVDFMYAQLGGQPLTQ
jgi:hypothetical protein